MMESFEFLGLNIGVIGAFGLLVIVYLIVIINKRRKNNFLHKK